VRALLVEEKEAPTEEMNHIHFKEQEIEQSASGGGVRPILIQKEQIRRK
jgi:hypothetical protein